jgi:hypothetical protein
MNEVKQYYKLTYNIIFTYEQLRVTYRKNIKTAILIC